MIIAIIAIVFIVLAYAFNEFKQQPKTSSMPLTPIMDLYEQEVEKAKETYKKYEEFLLIEPKYKTKETFIHWTIYKVEKKKHEWCGYQIPSHIERMWDNYYIINLETGETREVEQEFLDDLKEIVNNA
jgi:hypothetical protein